MRAIKKDIGYLEKLFFIVETPRRDVSTKCHSEVTTSRRE